jgi:drug/metabolite transporter (DMT)-like permease
MDRLLGVLLVAMSAVCFGANAILARFAYNAGTNPLTFLFFRFAIAALVLILVMAIRRLAWPRGKLLFMLFFLGGLGTGTTFAFYTALTFAPVSTVIVIAYMYPALVAMISTFKFKKPMSANKWIALCITLTGIILTIGFDVGGQFIGILLSVVTALFFACYLAFGEPFFNKAGPIPATATVTVSSAILYGLLVCFQGIQPPDMAAGWVAIGASAIFSTAIGCFAFFEGLKRIDASSSAIISTLEVIVAIALAVIFLGESITLLKVAGTVLVLSAVVILTRGEYSSRKRDSCDESVVKYDLVKILSKEIKHLIF